MKAHLSEELNITYLREDKSQYGVQISAFDDIFAVLSVTDASGDSAIISIDAKDAKQIGEFLIGRFK